MCGLRRHNVVRRRQRLVQHGVEQAAAGSGRVVEARLQPVTQSHQFDLGDDAILFSAQNKGSWRPLCLVVSLAV